MDGKNDKDTTGRQSERLGSGICGETLYNHFSPETPHVCKREKGHNGNHRCGYRDVFDTEPCGQEWPNT